jgi:hypothetical protein
MGILIGFWSYSNSFCPPAYFLPNNFSNKLDFSFSLFIKKFLELIAVGVDTSGNCTAAGCGITIDVNNDSDLSTINW